MTVCLHHKNKRALHHFFKLNLLLQYKYFYIERLRFSVRKLKTRINV